jgi:hypothetical protein
VDFECALVFVEAKAHHAKLNLTHHHDQQIEQHDLQAAFNTVGFERVLVCLCLSLFVEAKAHHAKLNLTHHHN